ncbi:MAG: hypothetical protein K5886_09825 [Lachnospiraceae bacterium]|nr:hypothetical protein [Lachnospiraceae bacterium]
MKKKLPVLLLLAGLTVCQLAGCGSTPDSAIGFNGPEDKTAVSDTAEQSEEPVEITDEGYRYANDLFEIEIPESVADIIKVDVTEDRMDIFVREWFDKGFGGHILSVWAVSLPREYAGGPYVKIGELTGDNGDQYDMVRGYATEIQWDYELPDIPEDIKTAEDAADDILASITGADGFTYEEGAGIMGEDLYKDVLSEYAQTLGNLTEDSMFENADISEELYVAAMNAEDDPLEEIGYAYQDINSDGIDELFIGVFGEGEFKGVVYDIYTMVDREPAFVINGTARNRYFDYGDNFICNIWSAGAGESGFDIYNLEPNSTDMVLQYGYKYDSYDDEENPWMLTYDGEGYQTVPEDEYETAYDEMDNSCVRFDYMPLSDFNAAGNTDAKKADGEKKASLPPFEYTGPELFFSTICDYIVDEFGDEYSEGDVTIPCPVIIAVDGTDDPDKYRFVAYGNFEVYNYKKNGDILECVSGGSHPGALYVQDVPGGYEVVEMDPVLDGSEYDSSAKRIFGDRYNEFINLSEERREDVRGQLIAAYVEYNGLDITAYQDFGWDPVELPEVREFLEEPLY